MRNTPIGWVIIDADGVPLCMARNLESAHPMIYATDDRAFRALHASLASRLGVKRNSSAILKAAQGFTVREAFI